VGTFCGSFFDPDIITPQGLLITGSYFEDDSNDDAPLAIDGYFTGE
jgi:hypothetical protein